MSGQKRGQWDAGEMVHPDDSILLAYIRQQPLDARWSQLHQHIFDCAQCLQRFNALKDIDTLLTDTLQHFQSTQNYPSLVENVFELIQDPVAARLFRRKRQCARLREDLALGKELVMTSLKRVTTRVMGVLPGLTLTGARRSSHIKLKSMPAILALVFLALVVVLVFSVTASAFRLFHLSNHDISVAPQPNATISSQSAVQVTNTPTAAPGSAKSTPGTLHPTLQQCMTNSDRSFRVHICGSHFTPGDKVQMVVHTSMGQSFRSHLVVVNAQGNFQDVLTVFICKDYRVTVSVENLTHVSEVPPILALQINQTGQCGFPMPIPTVGTGGITNR